ncbi:hypothetical protein K431DRAFT_216794 [Polychaeton citri CBS 116435]|uniref:Mechanosensitive ion channel protein n=1 Tax=Polychaeton citri CBS 116435 TaxID=1314669 RepID=A0A9P4QD43_9PEZI|nr:hypothetical protein K431DRAFT_216794 [Polychaeton citri CBS 116435]
MLGRRRTTGDAINVDSSAKLSYDGEEDTLTKVGDFLYKIHSFSIITRYALYVLPVAALLAIPLVLTDTVYYHARVGQIRMLGLFIWIEIVWLSLWLCKLCAMVLPMLFQAVCGLISTGVRKYSLVLSALEIPISLLLWYVIFAWSIVTYATIPVIYCFDQAQCHNDWLQILSKVFKAAIIIAAIFVAEKTFIQLISISYHHKQYNDKIKESKKLIRLLDLLYETSRVLFPEFCKEFEEEDADIQGNYLAEMRTTLARVRVKTKLVRDMGRVRDKLTAAFGHMASDITGKQVCNSTSAHSIVIEALETELASKALARRLWLSFVGEGRDALFKTDLVEVLGYRRLEEAEEIFEALDRDDNGDVSVNEMIQLVIDVGQERKNRATSMHDISQAIAVLDKLLGFVVLLAIALIYATFFSKAFGSKTTQLWTTFTGLAFAISGTVQEFLACCIFLFTKHPYDIGDRVDISGANRIDTCSVEMIVERISLMYTQFRRVDSDKLVQIPNNVANTLWIENVSRSRAMKERLTFSVAATTSVEDIETLKDELEKYIISDEHRRDFRPGIEMELMSVGDLKQLDLRVEIRHRSNFANDQLRSIRRNKFMCEFLAVMRRIPIEPPGGAAPPLGTTTANPSFSVTITESEAAAAKERHEAELDSKRLHPKTLTQAASAVFEPLASHLVAGGSGELTGLRGSTAAGNRASSESMRARQGRRSSESSR